LPHDEALVEAMAERSLEDKRHSLSGIKMAKFIKDFKHKAAIVGCLPS